MKKSKCNCGKKFSCYSSGCIDCLRGKPTTDNCPKCGSSIIKNGQGDKWCSNLECSYGKE